jgi:hypothetical protein
MGANTMTGELTRNLSLPIGSVGGPAHRKARRDFTSVRKAQRDGDQNAQTSACEGDMHIRW